jgi:hypothetical protein
MFAIGRDVELEKPSPGVPRETPARRRRSRRLLRTETAVALVIAACVLLVHDVGYLLRIPYWVDEAWVAASTRVSIDQLPKVTSVSPIGWTFLLRLVPGNGSQDQRLVPLAFAAATVLAAFAFGRSLRLIPIVTGTFAAGAALLAPAMLVRNDLKEYTADAFVAVLALALMSRLEAAWSRRRLITLGGVFVACALVSHASLLVAAAALPCLCASRLARRRKAEFIDAAVVTAATGVVLSIVFLTLDAGARTPALRNYWRAYYLPHGIHPALHYINVRFNLLLPYFGFHHRLLLVGFVLLGLIVLIRQGRWATGAFLPVLVVEVVLLSALHRYPLLDERTSTFLILLSVVIAAVGAVGAAVWLTRRVKWIVGAAFLGVVATLYILAALPFVRGHLIPTEDVKAQQAYVAAHARPGDVILVNWGANWGYAYYAHPRPEVVSAPGIEYALVYPQSDDIVTIVKPGQEAVDAAVPRALKLAEQHPGARLWIVRNHQQAGEPEAWNAELAPLSHHQVEVAPGTFIDYVSTGR